MEVETCQNCKRTIGNLETRHLFQGHIVCAECDAKLQSSKPEIIEPVADTTQSSRQPKTEKVILNAHPAMFRDRPLLFVIFILLIPVVGV